MHHSVHCWAVRCTWVPAAAHLAARTPAQRSCLRCCWLPPRQADASAHRECLQRNMSKLQDVVFVRWSAIHRHTNPVQGVCKINRLVAKLDMVEHRGMALGCAVLCYWPAVTMSGLQPACMSGSLLHIQGNARNLPHCCSRWTRHHT